MFGMPENKGLSMCAVEGSICIPLDTFHMSHKFGALGCVGGEVMGWQGGQQRSGGRDLKLGAVQLKKGSGYRNHWVVLEGKEGLASWWSLCLVGVGVAFRAKAARIDMEWLSWWGLARRVVNMRARLCACCRDDKCGALGCVGGGDNGLARWLSL